MESNEGELVAADEPIQHFKEWFAEAKLREPNDREATIFYALALNMAALPSDGSFHKQTRAAELLLVALSEQPNHPGLSHYLTFCLSLPSAAAPDIAAVLQPRTSSSVQAALAMLALAGVAVFFVSVLPVWSGDDGGSRRK